MHIRSDLPVDLAPFPDDVAELYRMGYEVRLNAGEALYLPGSWFHEVQSEGEEGHMAVNFWFKAPENIDQLTASWARSYRKSGRSKSDATTAGTASASAAAAAAAAAEYDPPTTAPSPTPARQSSKAKRRTQSPSSTSRPGRSKGKSGRKGDKRIDGLEHLFGPIEERVDVNAHGSEL